jgi:hypothetical protein
MVDADIRVIAVRPHDTALHLTLFLTAPQACEKHPSSIPHILSGTSNGRVCWWPMPAQARECIYHDRCRTVLKMSSASDAPRKRVKAS